VDEDEKGGGGNAGRNPRRRRFVYRLVDNAQIEQTASAETTTGSSQEEGVELYQEGGHRPSPHTTKKTTTVKERQQKEVTVWKAWGLGGTRTSNKSKHPLTIPGGRERIRLGRPATPNCKHSTQNTTGK